MKVLGKPDLNDAVLYDELELVMENFGVLKPASAVESAQPEHVPSPSLKDSNHSGSIVFIDDPSNYEFSKKMTTLLSTQKEIDDKDYESDKNESSSVDEESVCKSESPKEIVYSSPIKLQTSFKSRHNESVSKHVGISETSQMDESLRSNEIVRKTYLKEVHPLQRNSNPNLEPIIEN